MQNPKDYLHILSTSDFFEVVFNENSNQKFLRALVAFKKDDFILRFSAKSVLEKANHLTIQVETNKHIELSPDFLQFTNHSCKPNVFFNTSSMELFAVEDINPGDEICFFYPSTELSMARSFFCKCGNNECLNEIKGALFINKEVLLKYQLNDLIKYQLSLP